LKLTLTKSPSQEFQWWGDIKHIIKIAVIIGVWLWVKYIIYQ
jgi:hypothetical protein